MRRAARQRGRPRSWRLHTRRRRNGCRSFHVAVHVPFFNDRDGKMKLESLARQVGFDPLSRTAGTCDRPEEGTHMFVGETASAASGSALTRREAGGIEDRTAARR